MNTHLVEPHTAPTDLARELELTLAALEAERAAADAAAGDVGDDERLVAWFTAECRRCDDSLETLKQQTARMRAAIDARRRTLSFRWGQEFTAALDRLLKAAGGKRKSIDTPSGRAGRRRSSDRIEITDQDVAVDWACRHLADAVKLDISRTKLKVHVTETGEVPPGVEFVEGSDRVFPSPLITNEQRAKLEQLLAGAEGGDDGSA